MKQESLSLSLRGTLVCYISYWGNMVFLHSVMVSTRNLACQHWEVLSGWELALKRLKKIVDSCKPYNLHTADQQCTATGFYAPISGQTSDNTSLSFFNAVTAFPNDSTSSAHISSLRVPFTSGPSQQ